MKKRYLKHFLVCMTVIGTSLSAGAQFIHPGCLHTQEDLNRINAQLDARHPRVTKAWKSFTDNWMLGNAGSWIGAINGSDIKRGIAGDENYAHSERDFGMCYIKSIYWALKHNSSDAAERTTAELYAKQATTLLNKYAKKITGIGGNSNFALIGAFQAWQIVNAAELLSSYPGWTADEQFFFKRWVYNLWYGSIKTFMHHQNGTCPSHYHSNWGIGNLNGMQAIAVYLDDPFIYNEALHYLKWSSQNCSLREGLCGSGLGMLPWIFKTDSVNTVLAKRGIDVQYQSPLGVLCQNQESNRDQPHAILAMAMLMQTLEQIWKQGDNAYAWNNSIAAGGLEYIAGFLSTGTTPEDSVFLRNYPNFPWVGCDASGNSMSYAGRDAKSIGYQSAINHYANRMGLNMPYAKRAHKATCDSWEYGVEWGTGVNSRFNYSDLAGFGDLMYNEDSATVHPTVLRGKITMVAGSSLSQQMSIYNGGEYSKALNTGEELFSSELSNIISGSTVKLSPTIMDDSEDTGNWAWDDDSSCTTREREITLTTSRILRAHYTNAEGAVSTQMFCLHIEGEGWAGTYKPYYKIGSVYGNDSVVYVKKFNDITIGMDYAGTWASVREWVWEKHSLTGTNWSRLNNNDRLLNLTNVSTGAYYRVTMVNRAGVKLTQEFKVDVAEIDPYIISNGASPYAGADLAIKKGSSVSLYAEPNSVLAKSVNTTRIYKWVVGSDTIQSAKLTYHLDDSGNKVADLTDTLHIAALDTCMNCTLIFERISSSGTKAETIYHFSIPVYESNDLQTETDDSFYITDPLTGKYLNNTDATFTSYDEENDGAFLWRLRQLGASYGNRYMFISRANANVHLSEEGKLSTSSNYSQHSFNLLHKCTDENLYAIERSSAVSGGLFSINQELSELNVTDEPCREFPFRIVNVKGEGDPNAIEEILANDENKEAIVTYAKHGHRLALQTQEAGVLRIYSIYGRLLQTSPCIQGLSDVSLENEYWGVAIGEFTSTSGLKKSFKLIFVPGDF